MKRNLLEQRPGSLAPVQTPPHDSMGGLAENVGEPYAGEADRILALFAEPEPLPERTAGLEKVLEAWAGYGLELTILDKAVQDLRVPFPRDAVRLFQENLTEYANDYEAELAHMSSAEFFVLMDKLCALRDAEVTPLEDILSGKERERREYMLAWQDILRELAETLYVQYRSILLERAAESLDGLPASVHALRALGHFSMLGFDISCCPAVRALAASVAPHASRARTTLMQRTEAERSAFSYALQHPYLGLVAAGNTPAIHEVAADYVLAYRNRKPVCTNPGLSLYTALCGEMGGAPELDNPYDPHYDLKTPKTSYSSAGPATHLMLEILKSMGVPQWPCVLGWREDGYWKEPVRAHVENMEAVMQLESASAGSVAQLVQDFGVRCFRRYPDHLLLEQVAHAKEKVPYGYMLVALEDHNGAFTEPLSQKTAVHECAEQCGRLTRIIEFGSAKELSERLSRLSHRYGLASADFVYGEGHGSMEGIRLSRRTDEVLKADVLGVGPNRSSLYFSRGAPFLLDCCHTGKGEVNFGQQLSHALETTVTVPTHSSYGIHKIQLVQDKDGSLRFEGVHVQKKEGATTRTYNKGVLVTEVPRLLHEKKQARRRS